MLKLLERNIQTVHHRLVVVAPRRAAIPGVFRNIQIDPDLHSERVRDLQRLRGDVYRDDGAVRSDQLSADGLHQIPEDGKSWHLLTVDEENRVIGCVWYLEHERPAVAQLRVRHCALAHQAEWSDRFRTAIESEIAEARRERIRYAEVGGWAVADTGRLADSLLLLLGVYSLSQAIGGALVVATATFRHSSAQILRRIGGSHLTSGGCAVPPYYDPQYQCDMELLRFDTRKPGPKFAPLVALLGTQLADTPLIAAEDHGVEVVSSGTMIRCELPDAHQSFAAA
jgi:hypothetical protein